MQKKQRCKINKTGDCVNEFLSKRFGVSSEHIRRVRNGMRWNNAT